jgi:hypothetical protein
MRGPPLLGRGRSIDGRAQKRVAKDHPGAEREQAGGFRRARRPGPETQASGRSPQQRRIPDRLGRRHQQQPLGIGRQQFRSLPEALLDPAGQRQRSRQSEAARQFR